MRIDAHHHFWIFDPLRDQWINDSMKKIQRDFLPRELIPILKENSIAGCVAVQNDQSENETDFLLSLAQHSKTIKGIIGWVDLCSDRVQERLEYYSQQKLLKGFRHIVQNEADDFLLRKDFCRGLGLLRQFNFTYDILIYPHQLPTAIEFVSRFPDQKFVLDHLGKPEIGARKINQWSTEIEELAKHPNVWCKVSGMITEANWKTWRYDDFVPYLEVVVHNFGTGRILYGSDWPVCLVAGSYRDQLGIVEKYFRTFLVRDQEAVFGGNAVEFYRLKSEF